MPSSSLRSASLFSDRSSLSSRSSSSCAPNSLSPSAVEKQLRGQKDLLWRVRAGSLKLPDGGKKVEVKIAQLQQLLQQLSVKEGENGEGKNVDTGSREDGGEEEVDSAQAHARSRRGGGKGILVEGEREDGMTVSGRVQSEGLIVRSDLPGGAKRLAGDGSLVAAAIPCARSAAVEVAVPPEANVGAAAGAAAAAAAAAALAPELAPAAPPPTPAGEPTATAAPAEGRAAAAAAAAAGGIAEAGFPSHSALIPSPSAPDVSEGSRENQGKGRAFPGKSGKGKQDGKASRGGGGGGVHVISIEESVRLLREHDLKMREHEELVHMRHMLSGAHQASPHTPTMHPSGRPPLPTATRERVEGASFEEQEEDKGVYRHGEEGSVYEPE